VQRIFERYREGHSLKRIAIDLNDDKVVSPQPQKGRITQAWCPSSVRHILHNERYRGLVIWGKTVKVRSEKGTRIYRKRNESDWCRKEIPSQRIVSDKLFFAVWDRIASVNKLYQLEGTRPGLLRARASTSQYIFSGLLKCAQCGGSVTIVSGKSGARQDVRYGCSMHSSRGGRVCSNSLLITRRSLEDQLIAGLQSRVLHPDIVDYTLGRLDRNSRRKSAIARAKLKLGDGRPKPLSEKLAILREHFQTAIRRRSPANLRSLRVSLRTRSIGWQIPNPL
jgi:site-specific DNA recombinase